MITKVPTEHILEGKSLIWVDSPYSSTSTESVPPKTLNYACITFLSSCVPVWGMQLDLRTAGTKLKVFGL